ncbi:AAA ATPase [Deinococcus phoenicis]|uniref:AAA ATPase n=1 Tax=Deinococcus phoenicis TaxID=1476583 RepID=A0A016QTV4_9DEIO|nr:diguanylate cyclase [Deinococcus phoenicis]EYB69493.1 AAA ATPase [Deinococcus phoenicis]
MRRPATRDHLTHLHTRAAFQADLAERAEAGSGCALLLCDLDHLKLINDTFGHLVGDEALRALAATLRAHLRPGWQAYRLGGDEFAVVADGSADVLAAWGEALMEALAARPDRALRVSMGVAELGRLELGRLAHDPQTLFAQADARLYLAKRQGRGRLVREDAPQWPDRWDDPQPRLLERDGARAQAVAFLKAARLQAGRLAVQAAPGCGLSAFLWELDLIAQSLGYQTFRVRGNPVRARRQYGAWATVTLNGLPYLGVPDALPDELRREQPLAVLLDDAAHLDPDTRAVLGPLLGRAQAVVTGQTGSGPAPQDQPSLTLPPLSDAGILALAEAQAGQPLGEEARTWLTRRVEGRPARLSPWLSALLLEARLRRQPVRLLTQAPPGDWEVAVTRHVPQALPPHLPFLYGRVQELREAAQLLHGHALLTVTGPPGRGKTRLARQLLWEVRGAFAGNAHEVRLADARSPESVLARISEALIGTAVAPTDLHAVGRLLERRPTLLLLDAPAPYMLPARALETLLTLSPSTRVIVTAGAPLGLHGEAVLPLAPLPDAQVRSALVGQRPAPHEDEAALNWLTGEVGGEPGPLEALLPMVRTFGLAGTVEHLRRSGPAERAGALLWPELGAPERRVLAALSTFAGPFDLPWAEHVAQASPFLVSALLDHHLLQPAGGGLYRLPDTLLRQSQAQWQRSPGIHRRARERALFRAQAALSAHPFESAAWFMHLDTQYPVLRALLAGHLQAATQLGTALTRLLLNITPYRLARTYLYDASEDLQAARALHEPSAPPSRMSVGVQLALASTLQQLGQHGEAQSLLDETRGQAERLGDRELLIRVLLTQARVLHRRSAYAEARAMFASAHAQAQTLSGLTLAVRALGGQARSEIYLGDLAAAQSHVQTALRQAEALGQPRLLADLLNTAAMAASERRDLRRASELYGQALALHDSYGGQTGQTLNLTGLAWVALLRGEYDQSVYLSRRVLRHAQDAGQSWEIANALVNMGHALARLGQLEEARAAHLEGARLAAQCDAPSVVSEALGGLADLLAREDCPAEARTLLDLALAHPGATSEVRHFFAPLQESLTGRAAGPLPDPLLPLLAELKVPHPQGQPQSR